MIKIFSVGRFVFQVGFAKSGTWSVTENDCKRIYLLSLHIVKKDNIPAISIILGPFALMFGGF